MIVSWRRQAFPLFRRPWVKRLHQRGKPFGIIYEQLQVRERYFNVRVVQGFLNLLKHISHNSGLNLQIVRCNSDLDLQID